METSFTTKGIWRICRLASLLGCIVFLIYLNQSRISISFSTVQSAAVSTTNSTAQSPAMSATHSSVHSVALITTNSSVHSVALITTNSTVQGPAVSATNSSVQSVANSTTNSSGQSVVIFTTNSTEVTDVIENDNEDEGKKEVCNIFNGKWVYKAEGRAYHHAQCPFLGEQVSCQINGRPDVEYENWSWEAEGCTIPRFNATDMLGRLKNKRVIIVGDSLNRNQWESLACLLYSATPPTSVDVNVGSGDYKTFRALDFNCSVEFYWSPFLVELDENKKKRKKNKTVNDARILKLDKISASAKKWKGADVMVFNTGHWWVHRGKIQAWDLLEHEGKQVEDMTADEALEIGMGTWAQWVDENVNPAKTMVYFRSISPEHKGEQWCYNVTVPIADESYVAKFPKAMVQVVERTIGGMRTPVKYLNITKLSEYRVDAHPSIYRKKREQLSTEQRIKPETYADCSHWCLPGLPDTWNKLLYASIVSSTSGEPSDPSFALF